jgi:hypothetical protein
MVIQWAAAQRGAGADRLPLAVICLWVPSCSLSLIWSAIGRRTLGLAPRDCSRGIVASTDYTEHCLILPCRPGRSRIVRHPVAARCPGKPHRCRCRQRSFHAPAFPYPRDVLSAEFTANLFGSGESRGSHNLSGHATRDQRTSSIRTRAKLPHADDSSSNRTALSKARRSSTEGNEKSQATERDAVAWLVRLRVPAPSKSDGTLGV